MKRKYNLYPSLTSEQKFEEIIAEYYRYYTWNCSTPIIASEIMGMKCVDLDDSDHSKCCALECEFFKNIVYPLLTDDDKEVLKYIGNNKCTKGNKLPWEQRFRNNICAYNPLNSNNYDCPLKEIEICRVLVMSFFTAEYKRNPKTFDKLLKIILSAFVLGYKRDDVNDLSLMQKEIDILENHLKGNAQGGDNEDWVAMLDQSVALCINKNIDVNFISTLLNNHNQNSVTSYGY